MTFRVVLTLMLVATLSGSAMAADSQQDFSLSEKLFYAQLNTNPQPPSVVVIVSQKSLLLAGTLSLVIPGLGQFYNDQFAKGLFHFSITVGGVVLYIVAEEDDISGVPVFHQHGNTGYIEYQTVDIDNDNYLKMVSFFIGIGIHLYSAVDAVLSAKQINKQNLQRAGITAAWLIRSEQSGLVVVICESDED